MEKGKPRPVRGLGQGLMDKSLELAFEDPVMAVRFANLSMRVSAFLGDGYDPFAQPPRRKRGRRGKARKKTA
ncbi:MAG TPA: hypothetical protein VN493_26830 [Thermoanaerobaculia bacterium]|nr:hypothetical protein [Thermoanaerobaculia bacterium]